MLVFQFDNGLALKKGGDYVTAAKTISRLQDTLKAKKIPAQQINDFVRDLKAERDQFTSFASTASRYFVKNAKGVEAVFHKNPNTAQGLAMTAVLGPQRAFLLAKYDLSVHLKNGILEMQHVDAKGAKHVVFTTP